MISYTYTMTKHGPWPSSGFGGALRRLRESAGLSQPELAERVGVTKDTVSRLERGTHEPAWPLVLALARALERTPNDFVPANGEVPPAPRGRGKPKGRRPKAGEG